jgi:hypothetical protein
MKKGNQMEVVLQDVKEIIQILDKIAKVSNCIKPHYYLMKGYFSLLRSRTCTSNLYLRKAKKCAQSEMNMMILAWINHNETVSQAYFP